MDDLENKTTAAHAGDETFPPANLSPPVIPAPIAATGAAHSCARCYADLTQAVGARYCRRCGLNLRPGEPLPVLPVVEPVAFTTDRNPATFPWPQFPAMLPDGAGGNVPGPGDRHSLILLGYANAMYRLGWRYETGNGAARNANEAVRCYFKAAKLGNAPALSRLAPKCTPDPLPPAGTLPSSMT